MSSYRFSETSGQLNSAIMIVKENDIIVDEDFVVRVNLLPTGQTAQICRCYHVIYPGALVMQMQFSITIHSCGLLTWTSTLIYYICSI